MVFTCKKADGLSMNMMVLAVLALVVLLVMSIVFTTQTVTWKKNLNECRSKGGLCVSSETTCSDQGGTLMNLDCYADGKINNGKAGKSILTKDVCCYLECESQGGSCQSGEKICSSSEKTVYYTNCDKAGKICCLK